MNNLFNRTFPGVAAIIIALSPAALAQNVDEAVPSAPPPPVSPGLRVQQTQTQLQPGRHFPGVRYTTGSVTVSGWEKTLTDGDPNLRHWNWSAVTSYTQSSYGKVPAGAYLDPAARRKPGGIYVKPVHLSPDAFVKKTAATYVPVAGGPQYVANTSSKTGTGAKLLAPKYPQATVATQTTASTNVNAKVKFKKPCQAAAPAPAVARTYDNNYTNATVGGTLMSSKEYRDVYGRLMSKKAR